MKKFIRHFHENYFPIKNEELKKILPICLLKGLASSVYCIFINLKDVIIINAEGSGAETLTVVRGFIVLPFSILLVYTYSKLANRFKPTTIFYIFMTFFSTFLLIYSFILRPNEFFFSPRKSANVLLNILGMKNSHWVSVYKNWIHVCFYVLSELWLQSVIFILFWEFVNRVCSMDEAKRSYNLFIAAGGIFNFTTGILLFQFFKFFKDSFNLKLQYISLYIIFCVILLTIIYYFLNKDAKIEAKSKKKTKLSFIDGLRHIFSSKYLICLTVITVALSMSSNLIAITWKANLKNFFKNKDQFVNFIIKINSLEQLIATFLLLFVSGKTIRNRGWRFSAFITPIVILITGSLFFISSKFRIYLGPFAAFFGMNVLQVIVLLGAFQVLATKVSRYSFYDMTKEMAYIPLSNEEKVKGKAAIDTIGSRFGKSASSYIHIFILFFASTGSVLDVTVFLIPILVVVCVAWLYCANYVAKKIENYSSEAIL